MTHPTAPTAAAGEAHVGRVVAVSGARISLLLEAPAGRAGKPAGLQIGALVKMRTAHSSVFGMVRGLETANPVPVPDRDETQLVELDLIGETIAAKAGTAKDGAAPVFQRGVSYYPALGDAVVRATQDDLKQIYARPSVANVRVGTICQDQTLPAYVAVDELLGKHFAILGTTGSGKSCAVARILRAILTQYGSGHIVLLDLHNEYARSFADCAEVLNTETIELPYWLLDFEEMREIVIGRGDGDRQADALILKGAILNAKQKTQGAAEPGAPGAYVTADTPIPYRLSDVVRQIDEASGKLDKPTDSAPYLRLKERLTALQTDKRYAFMFPGVTVRDSMAAVLARIFRVPVAGRPITILDLSGVPSEILNAVISLLCRLTFDFALWSRRAMPVLLVCEEAQRYMGANPSLGFEPTKRALSRIAKEGRKYGVSLGVVSQRPSDLAVEILSQCNTIFAMRLSNRKDQDFVRATLSESANGLINALPSLRTGEAIAVGEGVAVPARLHFDLLPEGTQPMSGTASFSRAWRTDDKDQAFIAEVVERWRRQGR